MDKKTGFVQTLSIRMFAVAGDDSGSEDSVSKASAKGEEEGSHDSEEVVISKGTRVDSKLEPFKSAKECSQDVFDVVMFLNSDETQNSKLDHLAHEFYNKHSLPLERRMGTSGFGNEIKICMSIAILVEEILSVSLISIRFSQFLLAKRHQV